MQIIAVTALFWFSMATRVKRPARAAVIKNTQKVNHKTAPSSSWNHPSRGIPSASRGTMYPTHRRTPTAAQVMRLAR